MSKILWKHTSLIITILRSLPPRFPLHRLPCRPHPHPCTVRFRRLLEQQGAVGTSSTERVAIVAPHPSRSCRRLHRTPPRHRLHLRIQRRPSRPSAAAIARLAYGPSTDFVASVSTIAAAIACSSRASLPLHRHHPGHLHRHHRLHLLRPHPHRFLRCAGLVNRRVARPGTGGWVTVAEPHLPPRHHRPCLPHASFLRLVQRPSCDDSCQEVLEEPHRPLPRPHFLHHHLHQSVAPAIVADTLKA